MTGVTEKLFLCQMFMCLFRPLFLGKDGNNTQANQRTSIGADHWEGDAKKHFSVKKKEGFSVKKGGGNSVNEGFGKDLAEASFSAYVFGFLKGKNRIF